MTQPNRQKEIIYFPLNIQDMKAFIGAVLLTDVYRYPEIKQYWGLGGSINKLKEISESITYNKFWMLRILFALPMKTISFNYYVINL